MGYPVAVAGRTRSDSATGAGLQARRGGPLGDPSSLNEVHSRPGSMSQLGTPSAFLLMRCQLPGRGWSAGSEAHFAEVTSCHLQTQALLSHFITGTGARGLDPERWAGGGHVGGRMSAWLSPPGRPGQKVPAVSHGPPWGWCPGGRLGGGWAPRGSIKGRVDAFTPGTVVGFEVAPPAAPETTAAVHRLRERKHNLCACSVTARGSDALVAGPGVRVSGN